MENTSNKTDSILNNILVELKTLRQDVHNLQRKRNVSTGSNRQSPQQLPPARKLLQEIADRPVNLGKCWYHKTYGIQANPANCPGAAYCSFNMAEEITKMKKLIEKFNKTPAQQRLTTARKQQSAKENVMDDPTKRYQTKPMPVSSSKKKVSPAPETGNETSWADTVAMETNEKDDTKIPSDLETDLLLSDSE